MTFGEQATESFPESERLALLNYFSHESKLALGAAVCAQPGEGWRALKMAQHMITLQGPEPLWSPNTHDAYRFASASFMRAGIVSAEPPDGTMGNTVFQAEQDQNKALGFFGTVMEWSLHPDCRDIVLSTLFGTSTTSPATRYRIIDLLLDRPGLSRDEIQDVLIAGGAEIKDIQTPITRLGQLGVLRVYSKKARPNPTIQIGPQILEKMQDPGRIYSPLQGAVLQVLHETYQAANQPHPTTNLETLLGRCHALLPKADIRAMRRQVLNMSYRSDPEIWGIVGEAKPSKTKQTAFSVHPDYQHQLVDLRNRIESLEDPEIRRRYAGAARIILQDPAALRRLLQKSIQLSPYGSKIRDDALVQEEIVDILRETGDSTIAQMVEELQRRGLPLARQAVTTHLNLLAETGRLSCKVKPLSRSLKGQVQHYTIRGCIPLQDRLTLLNFVGNMDTKLLLAAMMSVTPRAALSASEIYRKYVALQGSSPAWVMDEGTVFSYWAKSFLLGELVEEESPQYWRIKPELAPNMLAFCGALMEWSLNPDHADISLLNLLGRTGTIGDFQSPEIRFRIYRHLLRKGEDTPMGIHKGLELEDLKLNSLQAQIRRLGRMGILATDSRFVTFNPRVRITPDVVRYSIGAGGSALSSRKILAQALRNLHQQAGEATVTTDLEQILDACHAVNPDADLNTVRRVFDTHATVGVAKGWSIIRDPGYSKEKYASVSIHPDYKTAVEDLCKRIARVSDPLCREPYRTTAQAILDDPERANQLVAKAARFSTHKAETQGGALLRKKIFEAVKARGIATANEVLEDFLEEGFTPDKVTVGDHLAALVKSKELTSEMLRPDRSKRRKVPHYSLPDTNTQHT